MSLPSSSSTADTHLSLFSTTLFGMSPTLIPTLPNTKSPGLGSPTPTFRPVTFGNSFIRRFGSPKRSRFFALSLLGLAMKPQAVESIGMKLDFVWAPYESNLTDLVTTFKQNRNSPDVLIMGSGLWHMLRVTNESDCRVSLQRVNR
ncbi:hypothetical protein G4B88_013760 [Cannabis sativa]|uniref:Uncharacterized protein n=1 Tax=Cannabis sativa TaxID=3483 RepID=A0A7J6I1G3_CANSA|nr:hypothetical protein G4B88_013760 [Cannabis sativa]